MALATMPAQALDVTWLGGTGFWSDANWTVGAGPTNFPSPVNLVNRVTIGAAGTAPSFVTLDTLGANFSNYGASILEIGRPGDRLLLQRDFTVSGFSAPPGLIVNNGQLDILGGNVFLATPVTLSGSGVTTVTNNGFSVTGTGFMYGESLTIASGHTLQAVGLLGELAANTGSKYLTGLVNEGTLVVGTPLTSAPPILSIQIGNRGFVNNGRVLVPDGGQLSLQTLNSQPYLSGTGSFELGENARLALGSLPVHGTILGPAAGALPALVESSVTGLDGATFGGEVRIDFTRPGATVIGINGTVTNNGNLWLQTDGGLQVVRINGSGGFAGAGVTHLDATPIVLGGGNGNPVLQIGVGHTLAMQGQIGNAAGAVPLAAELTQVVNRGTVAVGAGQRLLIATPRFDNAGGAITLGDASALRLDPGTRVLPGLPEFSGGRIAFGATGTLELDSVVLRDVELRGDDIQLRPGGPGVGFQGGFMGGVVQVVGQLRIDGPTVSLADSDPNPNALVVLSSGLTLAGPGTTLMADAPRNAIAGGPLTVASGHTLRGGGAFGSFIDGRLAGFVNQGTVIVDAPAYGMRFEGDSPSAIQMRNTGQIAILAGSTLTINGPAFVQDDAAAVLTVDGDMWVWSLGVPGLPGFGLNQGTLAGCGTIHASQVNIGAAVVQAAAGCPSFTGGAVARTVGRFASAAVPLRIDGNLHLDSGSHLTLNLGAPGRDRSVPGLDISGVAELAGVLDIQLGDADTVAVGDSFSLFSFGAFTGSFSEVLVQGYGVSTFFNGNVLSVLVTSAVPEPAPWALLLVGASAWLLRRRRVAI